MEEVAPVLKNNEAESAAFARGYFCAVSVALREEGFATTGIRSMFAQGGDPVRADPLDIELFRQHGLMA